MLQAISVFSGNSSTTCIDTTDVGLGTDAFSYQVGCLLSSACLGHMLLQTIHPCLMCVVVATESPQLLLFWFHHS